MSHPYQIEDGVPLPARERRAVTSPIGLAVKSLENGQSFFIPDTDVTTGTRGYATAAAKRCGKSVSIRKVDGGLRVWRTA